MLSGARERRARGVDREAAVNAESMTVVSSLSRRAWSSLGAWIDEADSDARSVMVRGCPAGRGRLGGGVRHQSAKWMSSAVNDGLEASAVNDGLDLPNFRLDGRVAFVT